MLDLRQLTSQLLELLLSHLIRFQIRQSVCFRVICRLLHVLLKQLHFSVCHQLVLLRPNDENGYVVRKLGDGLECSLVSLLDAAHVGVHAKPNNMQ